MGEPKSISLINKIALRESWYIVK